MGHCGRHRGDGALAEKSGLKLDVESYGMYGMDLVHPEGPEVAWTAGVSDPDSDTLQGRSYYVLAPAGDVWTSGRTLEALTFGAIPVVDETYKTDGGVSAKGCVDPASAWRTSPPTRLSSWTTGPSCPRR